MAPIGTVPFVRCVTRKSIEQPSLNDRASSSPDNGEYHACGGRACGTSEVQGARVGRLHTLYSWNHGSGRSIFGQANYQMARPITDHQSDTLIIYR